MFTTIWTVCCCTFTCYATCREHIEAICSSDIYIGMRCWSGRYGTDSEIWLCVCDKACMQFHLVMAFSAVLNHSNEPTIDEAVWLRNECRSLHRCKERKKFMQSTGTEQNGRENVYILLEIVFDENILVCDWNIWTGYNSIGENLNMDGMDAGR